MELRNPHIADVMRRAEQVALHARQLGEPLSREQLLWRPGKKAWSAGECFEHLAITGGLYNTRMRAALSEAPGPVEGVVPKWRPTLGGRFLVKGVTSHRRLKTARVFKPLEVREHIVEEFLRIQSGLSELMLAADGYDLNRIRFASPVTRLLRLNLGDAFMVLTLHAQRHLKQAERVTGSAGFPSS